MSYRRRFTAAPPGGSTPDISSVVDWAHPLAQGLVGCYIPSIGLFNLAGKGGRLALNSSYTWRRATLGGLGFYADGTGQGAQGAAPSPFQITVRGVSLYWRGAFIGDDTSFVPLIGVSYTTTDSSPFTAYAINRSGTGQDYIDLDTNSGGTHIAGTAVNLSLTSKYGKIFSLGSTFDFVAGTMTLFSAGLQVGQDTGVYGGGAPQYSSPQVMFECHQAVNTRSPNAAGICAYIWNRPFNATEQRQLDSDPFCFIRRKGLVTRSSPPAGGITVTLDGAMGAELLATGRANGPLAAELLATGRIDAGLAGELLAAARLDGPLAAELLSAARTDGGLAAELLAQGRIDAALAAELLATGRTDSATAAELLHTIISDASAAAELFRRAQADGAVAAELLATALNDAALAAELIGTGSASGDQSPLLVGVSSGRLMTHN